MPDDPELIIAAETFEEEFREIFKEETNSEFASKAIVNWMRGLSIILTGDNFEINNLKGFYKNIQESTISTEIESKIFNFMFMSINFLSSLYVLKTKSENSNDLSRLAIMSWYYGVYYSAKAMLTATDGSSTETHLGTANHWEQIIASKDLLPFPLSLGVQTLVEKDYLLKIESLENEYGKAEIHNLYPNSTPDAIKVYINYLKGSASYWNWYREEIIRRSKDFKRLNVENFRTTVARTLRDEQLKKHTCGFLHTAYRYRGKANYRESIFLGYGTSNTVPAHFFEDLYISLKQFILVVSIYCSKKVTNSKWNPFINSLIENSGLSIDMRFLQF